MKIINKPTLFRFLKKNPDLSEWLKTWILKVSNETWKTPENALKTFPKAKLLENNDICFTCFENRYLLTVSIQYLAQIVSIKNIDFSQKKPQQSKPNHSIIKESGNVWH
jgi:mRNA-degrading endonuclease HigB of HigAB toxin-antitoxin module